MKTITEEERKQIAIEEFHKEPLETICHVSTLKLGQMVADTNAKDATLKTEATLNGKRYEIKTKITIKEII